MLTFFRATKKSKKGENYREDVNNGPSVERILFNNENEHVFKALPDMSLLIRSKANSPQDMNHLVFEPFLEKDNGKRRIFQLSDTKKGVDYDDEMREFEREFDNTLIKDVRLKLNFDKTPTKKFKAKISVENSAEKKNYLGSWSMNKNDNLENNQHIFNSGQKIIAPSPMRRNTYDNTYVTKRFKLGQFNYESMKREIENIHSVRD